MFAEVAQGALLYDARICTIDVFTGSLHATSAPPPPCATMLLTMMDGSPNQATKTDCSCLHRRLDGACTRVLILNTRNVRVRVLLPVRVEYCLSRRYCRLSEHILVHQMLLDLIIFLLLAQILKSSKRLRGVRIVIDISARIIRRMYP